jgi:uncharacterized protein YceK
MKEKVKMAIIPFLAATLLTSGCASIRSTTVGIGDGS